MGRYFHYRDFPNPNDTINSIRADENDPEFLNNEFEDLKEQEQISSKKTSKIIENTAKRNNNKEKSAQSKLIRKNEEEIKRKTSPKSENTIISNKVTENSSKSTISNRSMSNNSYSTKSILIPDLKGTTKNQQTKSTRFESIISQIPELSDSYGDSDSLIQLDINRSNSSRQSTKDIHSISTKKSIPSLSINSKTNPDSYINGGILTPPPVVLSPKYEKSPMQLNMLKSVHSSLSTRSSMDSNFKENEEKIEINSIPQSFVSSPLSEYQTVTFSTNIEDFDIQTKSSYKSQNKSASCSSYSKSGSPNPENQNILNIIPSTVSSTYQSNRSNLPISLSSHDYIGPDPTEVHLSENSFVTIKSTGMKKRDQEQSPKSKLSISKGISSHSTEHKDESDKLSVNESADLSILIHHPSISTHSSPQSKSSVPPSPQYKEEVFNEISIQSIDHSNKISLDASPIHKSSKFSSKYGELENDESDSSIDELIDSAFQMSQASHKSDITFNSDQFYKFNSLIENDQFLKTEEEEESIDEIIGHALSFDNKRVKKEKTQYQPYSNTQASDTKRNSIILRNGNKASSSLNYMLSETDVESDGSMDEMISISIQSSKGGSKPILTPIISPINNSMRSKEIELNASSNTISSLSYVSLGNSKEFSLRESSENLLETKEEELFIPKSNERISQTFEENHLSFIHSKSKSSFNDANENTESFLDEDSPKINDSSMMDISSLHNSFAIASPKYTSHGHQSEISLDKHRDNTIPESINTSDKNKTIGSYITQESLRKTVNSLNPDVLLESIDNFLDQFDNEETNEYFDMNKSEELENLKNDILSESAKAQGSIKLLHAIADFLFQDQIDQVLPFNVKF